MISNSVAFYPKSTSYLTTAVAVDNKEKPVSLALGFLLYAAIIYLLKLR
jgi:hypothetical protein